MSTTTQQKQGEEEESTEYPDLEATPPATTLRAEDDVGEEPPEVTDAPPQQIPQNKPDFMTVYMELLPTALKQQKKFKQSPFSVVNATWTNGIPDRKYVFEISKGSMCLNSMCGAFATAYEFQVELTIAAAQSTMYIRVDNSDSCCSSGIMGGVVGISQTETKLSKMQNWFAQYTMHFIQMNGAGLANVPQNVQLVSC